MKILFPTDGSTATEEAFDELMGLLEGMDQGVDLTVLNVTDQGFEGADPQYLEETYESDERDEVFPSQEASQRAVDRCMQIAKKHGWEPDTKIREGTYIDVILEEAGSFDVLALHEMRSSGLKDFFKGSGTEKLVRQAPCSVLLVQIDEIE